LLLISVGRHRRVHSESEKRYLHLEKDGAGGILVEEPDIPRIVYGSYMLNIFTFTTVRGSAIRHRRTSGQGLLGEPRAPREGCVLGTLPHLGALISRFAITSELSKHRAYPRAMVEPELGVVLRFLMRRCRESRV
jgi:hypothetical protein